MNKILVLAALLAFAGFVSAQCATGASQVAVGGNQVCYCNAGYWGTDATNSGSCTQCQGNSFSTQGSTNTGNNVKISACNICAVGYYIKTAAVTTSGTEASAVCTKCPDNSTSTLASQSSANIASCTCYDSNASTLSSTQTSCACKTGYTGSVATTSGATSGCNSSSSMLSALVAITLLVLLI